jgi:hypothetical protein
VTEALKLQRERAKARARAQLALQKRDEEVTASDIAIGAVKGANTALLADFFGGLVDLGNILPMSPDLIELGKSAFNQLVRITEHHRGVPRDEMTPKYERTAREREFDRPFTEAPIAGRRQLRGMVADAGIGYRNRADIPRGQQIGAVGGEIFGGSIPFAAMPFAAAGRLGFGTLPRQQAQGVFAPIVQKAKDAPASFAKQEALAATLSGSGGSTAETIFPGNETAQLIGSVVAPLAPAVQLITKGPAAVRGVKRAIQAKLGGKEAAAAEEIQSLITSPGTRERLAQEIRQAGDDTPLTPGQITGDERLSGLERYLVDVDQRARGVYEKRLESAFLESRKKFNQIVATGDPQAIKQAAVGRVAAMNELLKRRVLQADEMLEAARDKTTSVSDRVELNTRGREILDESLLAARAEEENLWAPLPKKVTIDHLNTFNAYQAQKAELLPGQKMAPDIDNYIERLYGEAARGDRIIVSGDLLKLRSAIRFAQRNGNIVPVRSKALNEVVKGIDRDLAPVPGTEAAIAYTRNLNTVFFDEKSVVGKVLGQSKRGQPATPPETTLTSTLRPRERGMVNFRQLREAAGFGKIPEGQPGGVRMRETQEEFLKKMLEETSGYTGGVVRPERVDRFIQNNQDVLRELGLEEAFADTARAAAIVQRVQNVAKKAAIFADTKSFASKFIKGDIDKQIRGALIAPDKREVLVAIRNLAQRDGSGKAMAGVRHSLWQQMLDTATMSNGILSSRALREILDAPAVPLSKLPPGQDVSPTLRQELSRVGILNKNQNQSIDKLLEATDKFEFAINTSGVTPDFLENESALLELITRIAGANIGAMGAIASRTGSGLIAAHAGSRMLRENVINIPIFSLSPHLVEAMNNPKLMATLLEKPVSMGAKIARQRQLNAYLLAVGLQSSYDDEEESEPLRLTNTQPTIERQEEIR